MTLEHLTVEDARILALETGSIAGHTCKVIVAQAPTRGGEDPVAALRDHVSARLAAVPRCRQRPVEVPLGLAAPAWVDDERFDVSRHVRRRPVDGEVTDERLREEVARIFSERLERDRPMWTLDVIEPLTGSRAAYVLRIHHCMADGMAALRMGAALVWDDRPDPPEPPAAPWSPEPAPRRGRLAADGIAHRVQAAAGTLARGARVVASPSAWHRGAGEVAGAMGTYRRELRRGEDSPLDAPIGSERRVAFVDWPLEEVKAARSLVTDRHATVNDVVLAAVAGGLRSWLRHRGAELPDMRVKVPVSMHPGHEEPGALGNRDSFLFVDLPVAEPDPRARLAAIAAETGERKVHGDAGALYAFFNDLSHVARPLYSRAEQFAMSPQVFSLSVSNVPGPAGRRYVLGGEVQRFYSLAEVAERHGLRVAVFSFAGTLSFGLCADAHVVGDLDVLAGGIEASLAELDAAAASPP